MSTTDSQKYGLTVIRGGQRRRTPRLRTAAEIALDDRMRDAFRRCYGRDGNVPSRGVQEIREGRQAPWRPAARRAIEMLQAGVPRDHIKAAIAGEMDRWIDDLPDPPTRKKVA